MGVLAWPWGSTAVAQTIHGGEGITLPPPPAVEAIPVVDDYFGTKITDNYRWLEDAQKPDTRAFIDAQNAYTAHYLKQARIRPQVVRRSGRTGKRLRDQRSLRARKQLLFQQAPGRRTAVLHLCAPRLEGTKTSACSIRLRSAATPTLQSSSRMFPAMERCWPMACSSGGADETSIHLFNVKTGKTLEDELPKARYFGASFAPDGASLYYARNNKEGTLLYQHVLGTRISADTLIFGHEFRGEPLDRQRSFLRRSDRRWPLPGGQHQPRRAAQARGYCLPRPHQTRFALSKFWSGASIRASPPSMPRTRGT